jgi:putative sigma-54 modulation protein
VQVKISVRHGHLSESIQRIIRDKAEKLPHLFERLTMIEVTVDLQARADGRPMEHRRVGMKDPADGVQTELRKTEENKCRVEFVVQAEHKHDFVARESHQDVLAAVDLALDKVSAQLRRYKEKVQDHRRRPSTGEVAGAPRLEESSDE